MLQINLALTPFSPIQLKSDGTTSSMRRWFAAGRGPQTGSCFHARRSFAGKRLLIFREICPRSNTTRLCILAHIDDATLTIMFSLHVAKLSFLHPSHAKPLMRLELDLWGVFPKLGSLCGVPARRHITCSNRERGSPFLETTTCQAKA